MDLMVLIQLFSAIAQIVVALFMLLSVREIRKDRKRRFLEKRLEEFYIPLIYLFGYEGLARIDEACQRVEKIIVSKKDLCGKRVAKILPQRFTATVGYGSIYYFYFSSEHEKERWESIADTIWSEYIEVLKEYYGLVGVKSYVLPEKPRWMFDVKKV